MLHIEHLCVTDKQGPLIKDLSIDIEEKKHSLVTGTGKSVFLECLTLQKRAQNGLILWKNKPIDRKDFSYAGKTSYALLNENAIGYGCFLAAFYEKFQYEKYKALVKRMKIKERQKIGTLRQNQQNLLECIAAFCAHTELIFLDQPLFLFDAKTQAAVMQTLIDDSCSTILAAGRSDSLWNTLFDETILIGDEELETIEETNHKSRQYSKSNQEEKAAFKSSRLFEEEGWDDDEADW